MKLPKSIGDAKKRLTTLGGLVTASEWERSAIVWAFTIDGNQYGGAKLHRYTITEFAELKIVGLHSKHTVIAYRKAWREAMDHGLAVDVGPGDNVTLPELPFPPTTLEDPRYKKVHDREAIEAQAAADDVGPSKALDIAKNPKAMATAIKGSPEVARAAEKALVDRAVNRLDERHPKVREVKPTVAESVFGLMADIQRIDRSITAMMERVQTGDPIIWTDDAREACRAAIARVRASCEFVEELLNNGRVTDDALQAFLARGEA